MEQRYKILSLIFTLLEILHFNIGECKYIEGHLKTAEDWHFLARFCFLSDRGRLEFNFEYPQEYEPQNILLYFDDADQWPAVYKTDKTCQQKEAVLHPENNQVINLTTRYVWSGCKLDETTLVCGGGRSFRSARERWWFVAVSHCGSGQGLNLKYKMWMTNGDADDLFFRHFSADEFYIFQVDIGFLLVFFGMFVLSIVCGVILKGRQLFHTTYKMYMLSLFCEVVYLFFMCIALGKYAMDGREQNGLETFARLFEAVSTLSFLLLLILMGKGFTITRGRLSTSGSIKIAVFMTLYSITYAVLFIYEANFFDPGEVLYIYESPPGYGLIGLRLIGWVWFCYAIFFTLKHYPEKSAFYYPLFIFYTIWFWAMPVVVLVSNFAMEKWVREKVANGVNITVDFCGLAVFLFLTRPTAANKNFPYHVRTTQIGIMTGPPAQNGAPYGASPDTESFGQHPYAPSDSPPSYYAATGAPNFSELFTVSNTRSRANGNPDQNPQQKPVTNPFIVQGR